MNIKIEGMPYTFVRPAAKEIYLSCMQCAARTDPIVCAKINGVSDKLCITTGGVWKEGYSSVSGT
jgi:hypothetical protein